MAAARSYTLRAATPQKGLRVASHRARARPPVRPSVRPSARCVIISNETLSFNSAIVRERRNVFSLARKTATVNAAVKTPLPLRRCASTEYIGNTLLRRCRARLARVYSRYVVTDFLRPGANIRRARARGRVQHPFETFLEMFVSKHVQRSAGIAGDYSADTFAVLRDSGFAVSSIVWKRALRPAVD